MKTRMKAALLTAGLMMSVFQVQADCREQLPRSTNANDFTTALVTEGDTVLGATVTHETTGLMWMRCQVGQSFDVDDNACRGLSRSDITWEQALNDVANINDGMDEENNLSYSDWRVPSYKELMSVLEFGCFAPSLNPDVFGNSAFGTVWTSTPAMDDPLSAYAMLLGIAQLRVINKALDGALQEPGLWLVRDAD